MSGCFLFFFLHFALDSGKYAVEKNDVFFYRGRVGVYTKQICLNLFSNTDVVVMMVMMMVMMMK